MHIHGTHLNPNATNLYSAVADEKAAAAKQAAEVRKKLRSSASEIEGEAEAEAPPISTISEANEEDPLAGHHQEEPPASKKNAVKKKDAAEETDSGDISIWG